MTFSFTDEDRTFFCRMNTSRNMRRKDHCTDNKVPITIHELQNSVVSYMGLYGHVISPKGRLVPLPTEHSKEKHKQCAVIIAGLLIQSKDWITQRPRILKKNIQSWK